jgi:hypothetical protein
MILAMPYHVLVAGRADPSKFRALFTDLDEQGVRTKFGKPFHAGRDIFAQGTVYRMVDIAAVQIRETQAQAGEELQVLQRKSRESIDRLNRQGGLVFINAGRGRSADDLVHVGEDVTHKFLSAPPGSADHSWLRNPWVVSVAGGLFVAALAALAALLL